MSMYNVIEYSNNYSKTGSLWQYYRDEPALVIVTVLLIFLLIIITVLCLYHSHKKQKDSLEGSLGQELFVAELEFPKVLVPRLPQHTSNVNIDCGGKSEWSKQLYSLYLTSFLRHWYILILLFWYQSVFNWWFLV